MGIQNGIFIGDLALIKFFGDFEFDLKKRKVRLAKVFLNQTPVTVCGT